MLEVAGVVLVTEYGKPEVPSLILCVGASEILCTQVSFNSIFSCSFLVSQESLPKDAQGCSCY